jgi:hypothetical protein
MLETLGQKISFNASYRRKFPKSGGGHRDGSVSGTCYLGTAGKLSTESTLRDLILSALMLIPTSPAPIATPAIRRNNFCL